MDYVQYLYNMIFGGGSPSGRIDSEGQLRAAQEQMKKDSALDEEAKRAGFNNGAEYMAYLRQKQNRSGGTVSPSQRAPAGIDTAMAWHPANTLRRASRALNEATNRGN